MNKVLSIACFCMISIVSWAQEPIVSLPQEPRLKLVGIETGVDVIGGQMPDHNFIRASSSYSGSGYQNVEGVATKHYGGVKGEIRSRNNRYGLSAGLRFSRINSSLGKGYWSDPGAYFYFTVQQTDNSLEYLKVIEIKETSSYIGIPIAVNWFPFRREKFFTFYFKGGVEFNCRLKTKTTVDFVDNTMNQYRDAVIDRLEAARDFISVLTTNAGVKIGRSKEILCTFEIGSSVFLNDRTSSVTGVTGGLNMQVGLQLAL